MKKYYIAGWFAALGIFAASYSFLSSCKQDQSPIGGFSTFNTVIYYNANVAKYLLYSLI